MRGAKAVILTCLVTYNRLPLTKRCVESYMDTRRAGDELVIVDNASDDGTLEYLRSVPALRVLNPVNRFPGAACNAGWDIGLGRWELKFLHRSDNDLEYLPGWGDEIEAAFASAPGLALLGVLNLHEDRGIPFPGDEGIEFVSSVGGNVVLRAEHYRAGLRWSEMPWAPGQWEDCDLSQRATGFGAVARLRRTVANNMAFCRALDFPDYYQETARVRGIADWAHST